MDMTPAQALAILDQAADLAPVPGPVYRQVKEAVQLLAPIIAAHDAKAAADAANSAP